MYVNNSTVAQPQSIITIITHAATSAVWLNGVLLCCDGTAAP